MRGTQAMSAPIHRGPADRGSFFVAPAFPVPDGFGCRQFATPARPRRRS